MRWAAPVLLAGVIGALIGATVAKPKSDPFAEVKHLSWPEVR